MDKDELFEILKRLNIAYGNNKFPLTDDVIDVWYEMLCDYPYEDMQKATKNYILNSDFPPTIAGIVKEYNEIQEDKGKIRKRLNELRMDVFATWPLAHDHEDEDRPVYEEIVNDDLSRAEKLDRMVKERTYKMDHHEEDYIPIGEFLRSIENSELLG